LLTADHADHHGREFALGFAGGGAGGVLRNFVKKSKIALTNGMLLPRMCATDTNTVSTETMI